MYVKGINRNAIWKFIFFQNEKESGSWYKYVWKSLAQNEKKCGDFIGLSQNRLKFSKYYEPIPKKTVWSVILYNSCEICSIIFNCKYLGMKEIFHRQLTTGEPNVEFMI